MAILKKIIISVILIIFAASFSSAQWIQTKGPCGGNWSSIASKDSTLFVSLSGTGIFRSRDKGQSWSIANNGLTDMRVMTLLALENEIFAGTISDGLFISANDGISWVPYNSICNYNDVTDMAVYGSGILLTTDDGVVKLFKKNGKWTDSLIYEESFLDYIAAKSNLILISDGSKIFRSKNDGLSWDTCKISAPFRDVCSIYIPNDSTCIAGTDKGAFISKNQGDTWALIDTAGIPSDDNMYIRDVIERNDTTLMVSYNKVWISAGKGSSWSNFNPAVVLTRPESIVLMDNNIILLTSAGLFISTFRTREWRDISFGIIAGNVTSFLKIGETLFAGGSANRNIYRSTDDGINWVASDSGVQSLSNVFALTSVDSVIYAGCNWEGLVQSNDNGVTWKKSILAGDLVYSFLKAKDGAYFGTREKGILFLPSHEAKLTGLNTGLPFNKYTELYPAINVLTSSDSLVFAAVEYRGVFVSKNKGASWAAMNNGLLDSNVQAILFSNGALLAAADKKVFRSVDNGISWKESKTKLEGREVLTFAENGKFIFAGTDNGVFLSTDAGLNWKEANTGLTGEVQSMIVHGGYLLAGTANQGVWRRPISEFQNSNGIALLTGNGHTQAIDIKKRMNSLLFKISIPITSEYSVMMYDLQGRLCKSANRILLNPGDYSFEWSLNGFKSGSYLVCISIGADKYYSNFSVIR
jgi:photosystem II stability/assembly factor-like uncharacterized protein